MLAALLQNNNNTRVEERLPMVKIDRGGGGALWPRYDIVDIASAVAAFPEVAGEDPVARAARRTQWIGHALPHVKAARERQTAAAFLAGAQLADRAAREEFAAAEKLTIEQLVQIIDEVRAVPPIVKALPSPALVRGERSSDLGVGVAMLAVGLVLGIAIGRRRHA